MDISEALIREGAAGAVSRVGLFNLALQDPPAPLAGHAQPALSVTNYRGRLSSNCNNLPFRPDRFPPMCP